MNRDIVKPNPFPSIWQIVDTYGIRVLQNNGVKPSRLRVAYSLAYKLANEIRRDAPEYRNYNIRVHTGQCTDFMGMGVVIVPDDQIVDGKFEIDYVPCEHREPRTDQRRNARCGGFHHTGDDDFFRAWSAFTNSFGRSDAEDAFAYSFFGGGL